MFEGGPRRSACRRRTKRWGLLPAASGKFDVVAESSRAAGKRSEWVIRGISTWALRAFL